MSNPAAEYPEIKLYIDGQWTDGAGGRGDDVVNPATEDVIGRVPFAEPGDVDAAIAAAKAAFPKWRDAGPDFRSGIMLKAAALLHQRADEIGRVMTMEEGKP
ncbi:MAG: aldehyde dehydrogenase family protein, partial [Trebonia sp.]